jgi:uncharacterized protein YdhG (YjbR/CyaY superfamily)
MQSRFNTIDEYINTFPENVQIILEKIRQVIRETCRDAEEAISYGMPTFKLNGKPLVYFAAFPHHIGFYPLPSGMEIFKKELSGYKTGKGSIRFTLDKPIPYSLIAKMVAFRIQEVS